jgi:hypothetical protein
MEYSAGSERSMRGCAGGEAGRHGEVKCRRGYGGSECDGSS